MFPGRKQHEHQRLRGGEMLAGVGFDGFISACRWQLTSGSQQRLSLTQL